MRFHRRLLAAFALWGAVSSAFGNGLVPVELRDEIIAASLKGFWGNARDINGRPIEPTSEEERKTLPVTKEQANAAFRAGELSGAAQWCNLEWAPILQSLTGKVRRSGLPDKSVAFVAVVHGAAQGQVLAALQKSGACGESERKNIRGQVSQFLEAWK